jgi:hypothetical protein
LFFLFSEKERTKEKPPETKSQSFPLPTGSPEQGPEKIAFAPFPVFTPRRNDKF